MTSLYRKTNFVCVIAVLKVSKRTLKCNKLVWEVLSIQGLSQGFTKTGDLNCMILWH